MKHNRIIKRLKKRLQIDSLDAIAESEQEYILDNLQTGEIDIYRIYKDVGLAIEVKTKDNLTNNTKAAIQLAKDYYFLREQYKIKRFVGFYAYSDVSKQRGYNIEKLYDEQVQ